MKKSSFYDADYFEQGLEIGISNYTKYHWMPERSLSQVKHISDWANLTKSDYILDFGCAKGFLVKAFIVSGYKNTFGCDISTYALSQIEEPFVGQCKKSTASHIIPRFPTQKFKLLTALHVLEHITKSEIPQYLEAFVKNTELIFIRIPLGEEGEYVNPKHARDASHVIAEDLDWWANTWNMSGLQTVNYSTHIYEDVGKPDEADFLLKV